MIKKQAVFREMTEFWGQFVYTENKMWFRKKKKKPVNAFKKNAILNICSFFFKVHRFLLLFCELCSSKYMFYIASALELPCFNPLKLSSVTLPALLFP